jgi:hypothetical protein
MGYLAINWENKGGGAGGGGKRPYMRTLVHDCRPYFLLSSQAVYPGSMSVLMKICGKTVGKIDT